MSREAEDEVDHAQKKLDRGGVRFDIEIYTVGNLRQFFISQTHQPFSISINLNLSGRPYEYVNQAETARALVGTVKGIDLAKLYDEHQHRILSANIRNSLGNVKINRGIQATANEPEEAQNFWFYNNGITFVCDQVSFRSLTDTTVRLENAQIINGAQTVSSLWKVWRKTSTDQTALEQVDVLVKIIEKVKDIDFRRRVTLFANSQNAVNQADLVGTDTIQIELKRRLLDQGVYYEIRRGDYRAERDNLEKKGITINDTFSLKRNVSTTLRQL